MAGDSCMMLRRFVVEELLMWSRWGEAGGR